MIGAADGPIFICGAERSGTSLMYALLSSHPRLSMVRRTNMWRWFHGKFGDLAEPAHLDQAIAALSRYKRLAPLEPDWDRIRREFAEGPPTYGRLFELLHGHRAERLGRPRWGDKSLHSEYFAKAIFSELPAARVVHMVRDPRDRYASIVNRYDSESKGVASATGRWLTSLRAAETNRRRFPDRYRVVRFEDLLEDPVGVTSETCAFIGEAFVPEMMQMSGAPEHSVGNSSFGDLTPRTISTTPVGRYRTALGPAEIAFIELVAGRAMRRFGYALDRGELRGSARWRLPTTGSFRDTCRLVGWLVRERCERTRSHPARGRLAEKSP